MGKITIYILVVAIIGAMLGLEIAMFIGQREIRYTLNNAELCQEN